MDKNLEVFIKQNAKITFECQNENWKYSHEFSTRAVFIDNGTFTFDCSKCGIQSNITGLTVFKKEMIRKLKSIGVIVK